MCSFSSSLYKSIASKATSKASVRIIKRREKSGLTNLGEFCFPVINDNIGDTLFEKSGTFSQP